MKFDGACIGALAPARDAFHGESRFARGKRRIARRQQAELAANHETDDAVHRGIRHRTFADMASVAQHRVAVADLEDLLQTVGHEYGGNALRLERADDREELLHLGMAQRRGRLVHDDEARLHRERPRDLHHLLFRHREIAHQRARAAVEADAGAQRCRHVFQPAAADEEARAGFTPDEDILRNRHVGREGEFLVDGDDACGLGGLRAGEVPHLAGECDGPGIGLLRARQNLQKR